MNKISIDDTANDPDESESCQNQRMSKPYVQMANVLVFVAATHGPHSNASERERDKRERKNK